MRGALSFAGEPGSVAVSFGADSGGGGVTEYVIVVVVALPARSVAVTENVWLPSVAVAMGWPSGTVPAHVATPDPPDLSAQA